MLGVSRLLIGLFAVLCLGAAAAPAAAEPAAMGWATLSRFGGDADGDGRVDEVREPIAGIGEIPVAVRPSPAGCASIARARWVVDGEERRPVEIERGQDCRALFAVEGEGKHTIAMRAGDREEIARIDAEDELIVAIGDSVASGEGNPEGEERWLDPPCHRSAAAGFEQAARLLSQGLAGGPRGRSITFVSLACSGAEIDAGLLGRYAGIEPDERLEPYEPQVRRLRRIARTRPGASPKSPAVDAVLLSVGANDVLFSEIVRECGVSPGDCRSGREQRLLGDFERLRSRYDVLGGALKRSTPGTPVLITEYFDPTHGEDGEFCGRSVGFTSRAEARWAYEALLRPLNAEIEAAAVRNRWRHVGGIAADFERHGYCAGDGERWVRRLLASAVFQGDVLGTLHPSRPGHAAIAQRVVVPLGDATGLIPPPPPKEKQEEGLLDRIDLASLAGFFTAPLFEWPPWWLAIRLVALAIVLAALQPLRRFVRSTTDDPIAGQPASFEDLPKAEGSKTLLAIGIALAVFALFLLAVVFAAVVGRAILWLRFWSSQLPADQAVDAVSQGELVATGSQAIAVFIPLGLIAMGVAWLLDSKGRMVRSSRRGLVAIGLAELLAAILIGDFPFAHTARFFLGLVFAAVMLNFLVDRFLAHRSELVSKSVLPTVFAWLREFGARLAPGRSVGGVLLAIWRALPLLLLAGATILSFTASGPTRSAILLLYVLAAVLFVAPGGLAREGTKAGGGGGEAQAVKNSLEGPRIALAVAGVVCVMTLIVRDEPWLAATVAAAVVLALFCLAVAGVSGARFAPYGLAVLIAVPLFGASAALMRGIETPELQPAAALLASGRAICGAYVGESDGRLWMARVVLDEQADDKRPRRGSIFSLRSNRVVALTLGKLEPLARTQGRAVELRDRMLDERGGSDPLDRSPSCSPPRPKVEPVADWQRRIAERFQPELVIDREDGFWPVPVKTLFSMQDRRAVVCRRLGPGGECLRLSTQGEFPWSGGDGEWIEYPAADTSAGDQHDLMVDALGSADPARTAAIYYLVVGRPGDSRPVTIQYWFFYPFNYQPIPGKLLEGGYHEGDFESVGVLLSGETERPRYLWMARHDEEGRVFPWNDDALTIAEDHPTVYVARGSHASYETCGAQVRVVDEHGLVDDHPTCDEDLQLHLAPTATPMIDLSRVAWGCWRGLFGHKKDGRSYEQIPYLVSDAPRSPLRQQEFGGVAAEPCHGIGDPGEREGFGEEVVEEDEGVPATLRREAGRLDPLVDQCADWENPPSTGVYMVACDQVALNAYVASGYEDPGGAGIRIDVARTANPQVGEYALPAMRRNRDGFYLDGWRLVAAAPTTASVFASCPRGRAVVAASFRKVTVRPDLPLRLRDRGPEGSWALTTPDGTVAATAMPFPTRQKDGRLVRDERTEGQVLACGGA